MKSPITGKEMTMVRKKDSLTFRKEEFEYVSHYYICDDTGEQFTNTELDELNLLQVHNQYRDKYNLPFPDEIRSIRNKYDLPATKMSEILGFGINGYRNYESGEVPSVSNGKLIQLSGDPKKFRDMVDVCDTLDGDDKNEIIERLDSIIYGMKRNSFLLKMEDYLMGSRLPDASSGYVKPDFLKLTEMVKFFAEFLKPWKTVMNKLLFYTDFLAYRKRGASISGARYRAIKMGPVPNNYNSIYEFMQNRGEVELRNVVFSEDAFGFQFEKVNDKVFNASLFSVDEIEILNLVCNQFSGMTTAEIIQFSHNEKAWIENEKEKKIIDYIYAFDIVQI